MRLFNSPKILKLEKAATDFWKKDAANDFKSLVNPSSIPEYQICMQNLQDLKVSDFTENQRFSQQLRFSKEIEYLELFSLFDEKVVAMALFLPGNSFYPIHDHPEMLVFSKVLLGEVQISSFDLLSPSSFYPRNQHLCFPKKLIAKQSKDRVLKENEIDVVLPAEGNLHAISARKDTVVLDLLFNHYDHVKRHCSFFQFSKKLPNGTFELAYDPADNY